MQYNTIFTNCAEVSDTNYALLTAEQLQTFTQAERAFVLVFLADTLASLTQINADCATDTSENYFARLADAQEVMQNLQMLYNTLDDSADCTNIQFTLADAGAALCSYDTEYRECIAEQFEDACDSACKLAKQTHNTNADYATLALRVLCSY
jgi:hypothetical protein